MVEKLVWHLEKRKINDLIPFAKNPRKLSKDAEQKLRRSLTDLGLIDRPCINLDNTVIGGHQRLSVLRSMGHEEIEVFVPNRMLKPKELEKTNIMLNKVHGEFDYDILANEFEIVELCEWGFSANDLQIDVVTTNFKEENTQEESEKCPTCKQKIKN